MPLFKVLDIPSCVRQMHVRLTVCVRTHVHPNGWIDKHFSCKNHVQNEHSPVQVNVHMLLQCALKAKLPVTHSTAKQTCACVLGQMSLQVVRLHKLHFAHVTGKRSLAGVNAHNMFSQVSSPNEFPLADVTRKPPFAHISVFQNLQLYSVSKLTFAHTLSKWPLCCMTSHVAFHACCMQTFVANCTNSFASTTINR